VLAFSVNLAFQIIHVELLVIHGKPHIQTKKKFNGKVQGTSSLK